MEHAETREHYVGLSLDECKELFSIKYRQFLEQWQDPYHKKLRIHIVERLANLHGYSSVEEAYRKEDNCGTLLPFYFPLRDDNEEEQWWQWIEFDSKFAQGIPMLSRVDPRTEESIEMYVREFDKLETVHMWLKRMGLWDDERRNWFDVD